MIKKQRTPKANPEVEMMTVSDLATNLRISVRSVWRQVSSGKLPPPIHVGRQARWPVKTILDWLSDRQSDNESSPN